MLIRRLIWDTWNVTHITKHNVTTDEVEEVCQGETFTSQAKQGRIRVIGQTKARRFLGYYYVVTARAASRKERKRWREAKGGEN